MAATLPMITVVAGLIEQDGTVLICQRHRDGAFPLQWEFPGGKVEPGETYDAALRRELAEELRITAEIGSEVYRTRHAYPGTYTVELIFYHVPAFHGTLVNNAFECIQWEHPARLPGFDFLAGDAELIEMLSRGQLRLDRTL